jgi:hypothetical protein
VFNNAHVGIYGNISLITDNTTLNNGQAGIRDVQGSLVTGNTADFNGSFGLRFDDINNIRRGGYANNMLFLNNSQGAQVSGGIQLGPNVCGAALCP